MSEYPVVAGEMETLRKIRKGFSISRIGDGEVGVLRGKGYTREDANKKLTAELWRVLREPKENHIVGIPTMDPKGCKYKNWARHIESYSQIFPKRTYYSSLISRPDCGKWMQTKEYAQELQRLWLMEKRVTVVGSEPGRNKLVKAIELTTPVDFVECPWHGAYSEIDRMEREAVSAGNNVVLLSHGVSATVLAWRLCDRVQAIDIGSIGGFLCTMLQNQTLTPEMAETRR